MIALRTGPRRRTAFEYGVAPPVRMMDFASDIVEAGMGGLV
jgi:hypothetical protein